MFCALVLYKIEELTIDMGIFISYFWTKEENILQKILIWYLAIMNLKFFLENF